MTPAVAAQGANAAALAEQYRQHMAAAKAAAAAAEAAARQQSRWRCLDCDIWNGPRDRKCICCGSTRR